jgi:hypothetical protein
MSTPQELARFHIEIAIKLIGREAVLALVTAPPVPAAAAGGAGAPAAAAAGAGRGRRPGAAPDETRCQWILTDSTQCKNAHTAATTYCKIHAAKIDLIDL